jgi:hypothetical protein
MRDFEAPDEQRAQARTWDVVAAAFAEREPQRAPTRRSTPLAAAIALAALAAVALSPPGRAVVTQVRKAIGVEHADRALYSLPTRGRILAGNWIVNADGSTRNLGDYAETSWSPFGRFVVATHGGDDLVAMTPGGDVRWRLGRPDVAFPRWGGTHIDTRIAYFSGQHLRIVAGDGTGDRQAVPGFVSRVPPAWQPGGSFRLAYVTADGRVSVLGGFSTQQLDRPRKLAWSRDGSRLLVLARSGVRVFDAHGNLVMRVHGRYVDAAFVGQRVATLTPHALRLGVKTLFRTSGRLGQLVPSPDNRWLLVTWPEARQWLFVPTARGSHLKAAGNVALPPVAGWTS